MVASQAVGGVDLLRHDIVPVATGYLVFLAVLVVYGFRRRRGKAEGRPGPEGTSAAPPLKMSLTLRAPETGPGGHHRQAFLRYLASTFFGGYGFFLLIVVVFYFVIGEKSRTFISQALGQGSLFTFAIVLPAFLLLSFLEDRVSRAISRRRSNKSAV